MRVIHISNRKPVFVDDNTIWFDITKYSLFELFKIALRMIPDRIVIDLKGDWRP